MKNKWRSLVACFLVGCMIFSPFAGVITMAESEKAEKEVADQVLEKLTLRDRIKLLQGGTLGEEGQSTNIGNQTAAVADKGLSYMNMSDGSMGVNINGAHTSFGSGLIIASTWNRELIKQAGEVVGKESLAKDVQIYLGPGMNIIRDLAGGRTFEYYSEDPYLTANTAVSYVKGVQEQGVAVTAKHLMANNQEHNRNYNTSNLSERAMHEIYLPAFEALVKQADVQSLMTAANRMNGTFTSDNRYILTNTVKYDYGLKGLIMTDWTGTRTGEIAVKAGLDLSMPYKAGSPFANIENMVRSGQLDIKYISNASKRLMQLAVFTKSLISTNGLDLSGYTAADRKSGEINTPKNQAVSKSVSDEGIVLLKNEEVSGEKLLPLDKNTVSSVAVLGKYADFAFYQAGLGGSGATTPPYQITNLQGLKNKLGSSVTINRPAYDENNFAQTKANAVAAAQNSQYAIIFAGIQSTAYNADYPMDTEGDDRPDLDFPAKQSELIQAVSAVNPNTIVVLNGSVFEVRDWIDSVPAVMQTFYPGMEGGNAVADILFGDVNPSGKLTFTWPKRYEDTVGYVEAAEGTDQRTVKHEDVNYAEGVYVGYRYNDKMDIEPEFAFGHGLSYSEFSYSALSFDTTEMGRDGTVKVSVNVTNTGALDGQEVVQLYIHDVQSSIDRPLKELKGYQKVELKAGETKQVTFEITAEQLSYWDTDVHSFMAQKGDFEVWIGSASDDIRQKGTFTLTEDTLPDSQYQVVNTAPVASSEVSNGYNYEVDGTEAQYVQFDSKTAEATWNVTVEKAGNYSVIFRYSNDGYNGTTVSSDHGPNKITSLLINGEEKGSYYFQNTRWENVYNYDSLDVELQAGENTITLKAPQDDRGTLRINRIILQEIPETEDAPDCAPDDSDAPPTEETEDGTVFQIENSKALSNAVMTTQKINYSGSGYVDIKAAGGSVTFDIFAPTVGVYRLGLRYSNGNSAPAGGKLYINGVNTDELCFAPTDGWTKWQTEYTADIYLNTGLNEVTVVSGNGEVSLDKAVLSGGMTGGEGYLDEKAPELLSTSIADGGMLTGLGSSVILYFNEKISAGEGNITFEKDGRTVAAQLVFDNTSVSVAPVSQLEGNSEYTLTVEKNAVTDTSGNLLADDLVLHINTPMVNSYIGGDARVYLSGDLWLAQNDGRVSPSLNAAIKMWVNASEAALKLITGPDMGQAVIYIDDEKAEGISGRTIDLYSERSGEKIYRISGLSCGIHKITVEAMGTKNDASSGSSIGINGIDVVGTLIEKNISNSGWSAKGFSYAVASEPYSAAIDGNSSTRWSSGVKQSSGQWFIVDFGSKTEFGALVMYSRNSDYIREYEIYVSDDGVNWSECIGKGRGNTGYTTMLFPKQNKRYVKIVQKGTSSINWWCIRELYVFNTEVEDTQLPTAPEYVYCEGYNRQIRVGWNGAKDDMGVVKYLLYRDGSLLCELTDELYVDTDVQAGVSYTYSVKAVDAAGNISELSPEQTGQSVPESKVIPRDAWRVSAFASHGSYPASNAVDGNEDSFWISGTGIKPGQWFTVDMGTVYAFNCIEMSTKNSDFPPKYQVVISNDGINWSDPIAQADGNTGLMILDMPIRTARYIRLSPVDLESGSWWAIYELNVMMTDTDTAETVTEYYAIPRTGWTVTGSQEAYNQYPKWAIDASTETRFSPGVYQAPDQWFTVDLGTIRSICKLTLDNRADYPIGYIVQVSTDGEAWTAVRSGEGTADQTVIDFEPVDTRYIKITQTGTSNSAWWSIYDIQVYTHKAITEISREYWSAEGTQIANGQIPKWAIDDNTETRFSPGVAQAAGQYFILDMGASYNINTVVISGGNSDYARGYMISVSEDKTTWSKVAVGEGVPGDMAVNFPIRSARYIKIEQTGYTDVSWWSIFDLHVYCDSSVVAASVSGDISGDGMADATDLQLLRKALIGSTALTEAEKSMADVNGDGKIDIRDLVRLKKTILGH